MPKRHKTVTARITLTESTTKRLDKLKEITEADDYSRVFANSLKLYEAVIFAHQAGRTFCFRNPDGSIEDVNVFSEDET